MNAQARALLLFSLLAAVSASAQHRTITVSAFADRYVVAARSFDDLDKLENEVRAKAPTSIRVESCGSATGRSVKALAHRFRDLALEIIPRAENEAPCAQPALRPIGLAAPASARPAGIDSAGVERYWRELKP